MPLLGENMATKIARRLRERNFDEDIDKLVDKLTVALENAIVRYTPDCIKNLPPDVQEKFLDYHNYVYISPTTNPWSKTWNLKEKPSSYLHINVRFPNKTIKWEGWEECVAMDVTVQSILQEIWEKKLEAHYFLNKTKCVIMNTLNNLTLLKKNFPEAYEAYKEIHKVDAEKIQQQRSQPVCDDVEELRAKLKTNQ